MRSTVAFIAGTGLGYVLSTPAGRQRLAQLTDLARAVWRNPQVQARVTELEAKAADLAGSEGAAIKGRVTENLRSTVRAARGGTPTRPIDRYPVAPTGAPPTDGARSTAVGAPSATPPGATGNGTA